jgi:hypothetical protein
VDALFGSALSLDQKVKKESSRPETPEKVSVMCKKRLRDKKRENKEK